jgi:hypothetical protein
MAFAFLAWRRPGMMLALLWQRCELTRCRRRDPRLALHLRRWSRLWWRLADLSVSRMMLRIALLRLSGHGEHHRLRGDEPGCDGENGELALG